MTTSEQTVGDPAAAGREALARGDWTEARRAFEAALALEDSPEAWDGLGWAAWWLADAETTLSAREQAYRGYRRRGDPAAAARLAGWLATDYREFRGEESVGRGWLRRAHRLIDDLPASPDHGWLSLLDGDFALNVDGDLARAQSASEHAAELGRALGVADLEAVGLAQGGIALVLQGEVAEGMRRLEEAATIAANEELELPVSQGWSLCCLMSACEGVGDFPRAAQWCAATKEFTSRWGARQLLGICRSAYGRVLAAGGDWPGADAEMTAAVDDLVASRPGMASSSFVRLGELRARQGRTDEARELFERAGPRGLVGLGALALEAGDAAAAVDAAERVLRALPDRAQLPRLPALELLARARARRGEAEPAARACDEVEALAERLGTPYLRGRARLVAGDLARERGDHAGGQRAYEDAVDCLTAGAAPYDAAVARLALAHALAAQGRADAALAEAQAAGETFAAMGATRDAERARAPLPEVAATPALGELTAREVEVLRLVANGLSDAAIAEALVVSPHTVHRHVANIRTKLGLGSRAASVAYAARAGLI